MATYNQKYCPSEKDYKDLVNRFTYHSPKEDQVERYQVLREAGKSVALTITDLVPNSREKALALTKLEEAIMWANAGIARNE